MGLGSEFRRGTPDSRQVVSNKWHARKFLLKGDRYTKMPKNWDPERPSIITYDTPGRGENGESSN